MYGLYIECSEDVLDQIRPALSEFFKRESDHLWMAKNEDVSITETYLTCRDLTRNHGDVVDDIDRIEMVRIDEKTDLKDLIDSIQ